MVRLFILGGVFMLGVLAAVPSLVWAAPPQQTGDPIAYGDTVSGEISESVPCQYFWFEGAAGDPVTLDMKRTSGSLDGVLTLYLHDDFTAAPVAFNDDRSGGGLDPLIETTLPANDWYTAAACRLQHENMRSTGGTFALTLTGPETEAAGSAAPDETSGDAMEEPSGGSTQPTSIPSLTEGIFAAAPDSSAAPTATPAASLTEGLFSSAPAAPQPAAVLITYGTPFTGSLDADALLAVYPLEVQAGDLVQIDWRRTSGDLIPQIGIYDANNNLIALVASESAVDHLQLVFRAPADIPLTLAVARYGGEVDGTAGTYELLAGVME